MTTRKKPAKRVAPAPTEGEKRQIEVANAWLEERMKIAKRAPSYVVDGGFLGYCHSDIHGFLSQRAYALGSTSLDFGEHVERALTTGPGLQAEGVTVQDKVDALNAGMKFIGSNNPESEAGR